ncbi:hypothetical protein K7432_008189 [Basidiobolus ranarum]|uniref:Carrier domain-containing protein n=1 Tax=Basidiobolus ranarum TaxID=34480 RepID=A0ABR2WS64_9FUNG
MLKSTTNTERFSTNVYDVTNKIADFCKKSSTITSKSFTVSSDLRVKLHDLSQKEKVALSTILLSAFQILLGSYIKHKVIVHCVEDSFSGINNHCIVHDIWSDMSFRELLHNVEKTKLQRTSGYKSAKNSETFFTVLFSFHQTAESAHSSGEDREHPLIELHFQESTTALNGLLQCQTDLFEDEIGQQMISHFLNILESIAQSPEVLIKNILILDEKELEKLLVTWNDTKTDLPTGVSMINLFEGHVTNNPHGVALINGNVKMTYLDLERYSNALAHRLRDVGVNSGTLVAVCMERSQWLVTCFLAVLKAGGAYLPLDPSYPAERLDFMIRDSKCQVVLIDRPSSDLFSLTTAKVIAIHEEWGKIQNDENNVRLDTSVAAEDLAYVMYTSGSTGTPKGVMIEHKSVIQLVCNTDYFQATAKTRIAQICNTSFDVSTLEIWSALLNGGTLVCINRATSLNLVSLESEVRRHGINSMVMPTALFNQIMIHRPTLFTPLECVMFGGEPANIKLVQKYLDFGFTGRLLHLYGLTEVTVCSTWYEIKETLPKIPVGRPISNNRAYVLNENLQPVPIGAVGELFLAGNGLARGYLNRPDLTAAKFVNPVLGERIFRTGDLARWRADGNLEYIGRIDDMVKIRGNRVELGEVRDVVMQHALVKECVIVPLEDGMKHKRLVGYITRMDANDLEPQYVNDYKLACDEYAYDDIQRGHYEPTFNTAGWTNTYDGTTIPQQEMREWLEDTLNGIKSLRPKHVLEIGCGSGMIMFNIAPQCEVYVGTDLSEAALDYVRGYLKDLHLENIVQLQSGGAHELDSLEVDQFDTVIINSVLQHFPGIQYLNNLLNSVIKSVKPGGHIFLGDIRGKTLSKYHYSSLALFKANKNTTVQELRKIAKTKESNENELLLDPAYFFTLKEKMKEISHVQVIPKLTSNLNEMSKFRYQVVLHIGCVDSGKIEVPRWLDWKVDCPSLDCVRDVLQNRQEDILAIKGIPNKRLEREIHLQQTLDGGLDDCTAVELQKTLDDNDFDGASPDQLYLISKEKGFSMNISWSHHDGGGVYDVVFWRSNNNENYHLFEMPEYTNLDSENYNNPLHRKLQQFIPELKNFLRKKLPDFMTPADFVVLESLPLTENGKIDYKALPAPPVTHTSLHENYIAPRTSLEENLAEIMQKVLAVQHIGIHDTFLSLGGDSLSVIEICSLCHKAGYPISSSQIFDNPTVAMLAEYLSTNSSLGSKDNHSTAHLQPFNLLHVDESSMEKIWEVDVAGNGIQKDFVENIIPCIPLQGYTVYETILDKSAQIFQTLYSITAPLDTERFQKSCVQLCHQNPVLRTVFVLSNAKLDHLNFLQIVIKEQHFQPEFHIVNCTSVEEKEKAVEKYIVENREKGMRLGGNMIRFALFCDQTEEYRFVWTIHHSLMDGWTMELLLSDLIQIYEHGSAPIRPLYLNFVDSWFKQDMVPEVEYWKNKLDGVSGDLIPRQLPTEYVTSEYSSGIKLTLTCDITGFCKTEDLMKAVFFKAVWVITMGLYAQENDIFFGDVIIGRNMPLEGIAEMVGMCFNVLPFRIEMKKEERLIDLLRRFQAEQHNLLPFENVDLAQVLKNSVFADRTDMQKVFGSFVAYQNYRRKLPEVGFSARVSEIKTYWSIHPTVMIEGFPVDDGLQVSLSYNHLILPHEIAQKHLNLYKICANYILTNPFNTVIDLESVAKSMNML